MRRREFITLPQRRGGGVAGRGVAGELVCVHQQSGRECRGASVKIEPAERGRRRRARSLG